MRGFWSRRSSSASHEARRLNAPVLESLSRALLDASVPVVYPCRWTRPRARKPRTVRFGEPHGLAPQPLTVYYQVSGNATPGTRTTWSVGVLTIPAGKKYASLLVLPIDDFIVDPNETVVIKSQRPRRRTP